MNKVLADLTAFAKQYMRSGFGAFFTFIFPILLILLFGAIFTNTGSSTMDLPTQNLDTGPMGAEFLKALNETKVVRVTMIPATVDLQRYIQDNSLSVALYIPANWTRDVFVSNASTHAWVNVTVYGDPSKSTYGMAIGVVQAVAQQANFFIAGARPIVGVDPASIASPQYQYIDYFLPGIIGMTVMTTAMFSMTSVCGEYRTRKYFKLLATTTLSKAQWLASKMLWYAIALIASLIVTTAVGVMVFGMHVTINAMALVFIVVGAILFTSLGMLLGIVVKDPESGAAVANAIGFPMMFLSGSFWPLESMPGYLQTVAKALPLTYLNSGLRDAMVYQNMGSALVNLGVLAALAAVLFTLAAKLVSWKER
ncbi:MAG: hypothetical protein A3K65_00040 [Euryarchaeota archaeon RBG_16_68_12]|nr:MAG: hypothetical protein A3K65_00040 [Euryarchaeota archaeon RBG_16_68_12]